MKQLKADLKCTLLYLCKSKGSDPLSSDSACYKASTWGWGPVALNAGIASLCNAAHAFSDGVHMCLLTSTKQATQSCKTICQQITFTFYT